MNFTIKNCYDRELIYREILHLIYAEVLGKSADMHLIEENPIVVAKLPSGKSIGLNYCVAVSPDCTEFERAEHEEREIKKILTLKEALESGQKKLEDEPELKNSYIYIDDSEVSNLLSEQLLDKKREKLKWLKVEKSLLGFDAKIKAALGLDKAQPNEALECLNEMLLLDVEPLMLKKHPHVFDMVKRLRRYVGNIKEWNLTAESLDRFRSEAAEIRSKADEVYIKFKVKYMF